MFNTAAAAPPGTSFTFGPVADTYVSQASPSNSYATSTTFSAVDGSGSAKQIFIRFDVGGMPVGAVVNSAKLRLYVTNELDQRRDCAERIGQFVAGSADMEQQAGDHWAVRATLGAVAINTAIEVDLGAAITGNGSYSFAITLPAGNSNTVGYAARENSAAANRPQLVITTN